MGSVVQDRAASGLERSCGWIRTAPSAPGVERMEAFFAGAAFAPHRHDTYAVGFTLTGVQSFRYRGSAQQSLPGQVFVLHPDETHDGRAGDEAGFRYRILYVAPRAIEEALGAAPLPFMRRAVSGDRRIAAAIRPALLDLDRPLEALERDQLVLDLAEALAAADPSRSSRRRAAPHWPAIARVRDYLEAHMADAVGSAELEGVAGLSRYAVARHFRACLGTSPYRYLVLRRLDRVRALIGKGTPLVEAALAAGFADQSHMTRHFKRAYGLPPGRWAALCGARR